MRVPPFFVAVSLLLAVISCKKDGSFPLNTPAVYYKTSKLQTSATRVFTLSGEIKIPSLIYRFENLDSSYLIALSNQLFPYKGRVDSIRVKDAKNIDVNDAYQYKPYKAVSRGNQITLTAKDTTTDFSNNEVYTRTIHYNIGLYKPPVFQEYLFSSVRGVYVFGYTTLNQLHLKTEGDRLRLAWIIGTIHYTNGSTNVISIQNKIDLNVNKSLAAGDTVVVREYAVFYEK
jgi:hypothetical protein